MGGHRRSCPVVSGGARIGPLQTVGSGRDRHRLHPRLRGSCRPAPATGQQPPGRLVRRAAGRRGGCLRGRGGRLGDGRPPDALGVPDGGLDPDRAQVPAPAARARRGRDRRGAGRLGGARPAAGPAARVPGLRRRRRRVRPPARAGGPVRTPDSRARPRLRGPRPRPPGGGHPRQAGRRLPPGHRRATRARGRPLPRDRGHGHGGRHRRRPWPGAYPAWARPPSGT